MKKHGQSYRKIVLTALFASLITVGALIPPIPAGPLPVTLQTLAVYTTAGMLGAKWGSAALAIYIALGAIGLPVFSGGQGGIGVLTGATGGYIIGFFAIPIAVGLSIRLFGRKSGALAVGMAVGTLVCYAIGTAWFMLVYTRAGSTVTLGSALTACVIPFLLPDAIKITLAVGLTGRLWRRIQPNR